MKIARSFLAVLAVTLVVSHVASATPPCAAAVCKIEAPEIDPSLGMGALALLSGAILVIRGRKKA